MSREAATRAVEITRANFSAYQFPPELRSTRSHPSGETPVFSAAFNGNVEEVRKALDQPVAVDHENVQGQTALFDAAGHTTWDEVSDSSGRPEMVSSDGSNPEAFEYLLSCGANPFHRDDNGNTLLRHAIAHGQIGIAERLIELGLDPNEINLDHENLLFAAIDSGNLDCVKFCLQLGLDLNKHNRSGVSPALRAAECLGEATILSYLIDKGADPLHLDHRCSGILHRWVPLQDLRLAETIIECGADVNTPDLEGRTPLFHVSSAAAVDLLLKHGADLEHKDKRGRTALFHLLNHQEAFDALVAAGADISATDHLGAGLLHWCRDSHVPHVDKLLTLGLDSNMPDEQGNTPLIWATLRNNHELVCHLLDNCDANPHHENKWGASALFIHLVEYKIEPKPALMRRAERDREIKKFSTLVGQAN